MKYLKNVGKSLGYMSIIIIVLTLIITVLSYFNIFNDNIIKVMKLIVPIISVFIAGILMGNRTNKKGIYEGFRLSIIIIFIFMFLSIILSSFKPQSLIYYLIIIISTVFGSIIGVQKKTAH